LVLGGLRSLLGGGGGGWCWAGLVSRPARMTCLLSAVVGGAVVGGGSVGVGGGLFGVLCGGGRVGEWWGVIGAGFVWVVVGGDGICRGGSQRWGGDWRGRVAGIVAVELHGFVLGMCWRVGGSGFGGWRCGRLEVFCVGGGRWRISVVGGIGGVWLCLLCLVVGKMGSAIGSAWGLGVVDGCCLVGL